MGIKQYLLIVSIGLSSMTFLGAVEREMVINDYSYNNGLTTNIVNCTFRDSRGFLWICSINGLYRYDGYSFQKLNTKNKVLNCEVLHITEDHNQNLWIATAKKGLVFYDTHTDEIVPVLLDVHFSFNINKIFIFKKRIWLATDSGLIVFDQEKEFNPSKQYNTRIILPAPNNPADQKNKITFLYVGTDSINLWIGTNGGLYVLNTSNFVMQGIFSHPQNAIRVILPFNQKLLIGSWDGGVFGVNPQTLQLEKDNLIGWINRQLERKRVISACLDSNQHLWIATYGDGLYDFDIVSMKVNHYSCRRKDSSQPTIKSDVINHILYDREGIIWVSMNQPALTKIFYKQNNLKAIDLENLKLSQSLEVSCLTRSNRWPDNVWIGTTRNGLIQYSFSRNTLNYYSSSPNSRLRLPSDEISLVYEDRQGNLWLVHRIMGLFVVPSQKLINLEKSLVQVVPIDANNLFGNAITNSYITTFYEDSKGRLWIGLWGALYVLNLKSGFGISSNSEQIKANCSATCIYSDIEPSKVSFPISPTQAIVELEDGKYFVGTRDEGIVEIEEKSEGKFSAKLSQTCNTHLPSEFVRCFYKAANNILWIGTNNGACAYHLRNNQFTYFDERHGLSSENINQILADTNGNIWLSTSFGISQINLTGQNIKNYLFDEEKIAFNYLINAAAARLANGLIVFSTNKAVVYLSPDSLKDNISQLPLYFTNLKINNETVSPGSRISGRQIITHSIYECKKVKVPYNATLTLDFAALDFIHNYGLKYKYRINSNEWVALERNQRSVSFYNQNPGEYQLQLLAQHPSGFTATRSIYLEFLPPWWKTIWAYGLYTLVIIALFISYRNLIVQRIRQKTKLEQEQFEKMKIQELDKLKTYFITNLAHEIRTPLSLIINPLESLIKENKIEPEVKEKLNTTLKNSYRLMKLTNELSDYTKIEKELIRPEFKNYDLILVIKEIFNSFTALSETMGIDFQFYSAFERLVIGFDKEMIEKIVFNLLSNAFKFTPKNGSIVVEVIPVEEQGKMYVKINVTNTGEGIPEDKMDKIFDRFYQIDYARQGLGIGLSIVKSLVEMHDGLIKVRSTPGLETSFEVYLPFRQANQTFSHEFSILQDTSPARIAVNENNTKPKHAYKLLIVEDDEEILQYLINEFSVQYKVYSAVNGKDGLRVAQNVVPDIIITDIIMPEMNGIELCKHLRASITTSHIPIIILSARPNPEHQIEGLDAGANTYLVKPFHIQVLKNQVEQLIQLKETIYRKFIKATDLLPGEVLNNDLDKQFLEKVLDYIETNLSNPNLSVDELASHVFLSKVQLYRKIKAITGMSVIEFITSIRLRKAARLIVEKQMSFAQIAYETGFSSPSYFTKCFREHYGKTPREYIAAYLEKQEGEDNKDLQRE